MSRRTRRILTAVVLILIAGLVWQFAIRPNMSRYQEYKGTLEDAYRLYDPTKYTYEPHRAEHKDYNHFWRIKCEDGQTRDVMLPYDIWRTGRLDAGVIKESGRPYPEMVDTSQRGNVREHVEKDSD